MTLQVIDGAGGAGAASSVTAGVDNAIAGDYLLRLITISAQTVTTPAGWVAHYAQPVAGGTRRVYIFGKECGENEQSTTFSFSAAANVNALRLALRGQDRTSTIDVAPVSNSASTNASTLTAPSLTTIAADALFLTHFAVISTSTSATSTTPAGMSLVAAATGTGSAGLSARLTSELRAVPGSTGTRTSTSGVSAPWAATSFAIRPASTPVRGRFFSFFG